MKGIVKNAGLLFIVAGLGLIVYKQLSGIDSNSLLAASLASMIFGLVLYVLLNYLID